MRAVESLLLAFTLAIAIAFGSLIYRSEHRRSDAVERAQNACERRCAPHRPVIDELQRCWCDLDGIRPEALKTTATR